MIIKARHHPIIYSFFKLYVPFIIWRNFHKISISGDYREKNKALLLIANHVSWWDGFWAVYLKLKLLHRRFHFMMQEDQLRRFSIFINAGGYSIKKGSRTILESINYTIELLSDKNNLVLLFPQGKITSLYNPSFHFERGLERIIKEVYGKAQIIFVANLIDYFSNKKPSLFIYLKEYENLQTDVDRIQEEFNMFYSGCVAENIKKAGL